jgi:hypothetical protein
MDMCALHCGFAAEPFQFGQADLFAAIRARVEQGGTRGWRTKSGKTLDLKVEAQRPSADQEHWPWMPA